MLTLRGGKVVRLRAMRTRDEALSTESRASPSLCSPWSGCDNETDEQTADGAGLILLDDQLRVVGTTEGARHRLAEVGGAGAEIGELPSPVLAAASSLQALERDPGGSVKVPRSRLRTASGRWLVVHASRLAGDGDRRATSPSSSSSPNPSRSRRSSQPSTG